MLHHALAHALAMQGAGASFSEVIDAGVIEPSPVLFSSARRGMPPSPAPRVALEMAEFLRSIGWRSA